MKNILPFIFFISMISSSYATEQESDLLIIDNDTIYLKTFFLEKLNLAYKPFGYTHANAPSTACWRGYRAVWRVIDHKLYLEKIIRCYTDRKKSGEQNIFELFNKNGLKYRKEHGMIYADWVSENLYQMNFSIARFYNNRLYLYDGWNLKNQKEDKYLKLKIVNGVIKVNHIKP